MRINFVTEPKPYWILGRWCEEWAKHMPDTTISASLNRMADVNIFCNYALFDVSNYFGKTVSIFTHRELHNFELQRKFDAAAVQSSWCVAQSIPTAKLLPAFKTTIIHPCVGEHFMKGPIKIGVVGRDYESGRKRFEWLEELRKIDGVEIIHTNNLPYEIMDHFYSAIDYLLITAENEGGPMPVTEALAMKKPVIAPRGVGWCDEYTTIKYDNTLDSLITVVKGLIVSRDGWEVGAKRLLEICEAITSPNFTVKNTKILDIRKPYVGEDILI